MQTFTTFEASSLSFSSLLALAAAEVALQYPIEGVDLVPAGTDLATPEAATVRPGASQNRK